MEAVVAGLETKESGRLDPDKGIWAPLLWKCLHSFVELSGRSSRIEVGGGGWFGGFVGSIAIDEARELFWLLRHLDYIIPCAKCRVHCVEYRTEHPLHKEGGFVAVKNVVQGWNKEEARRWLWEFHESVNVRLEKNTHIKLEDLEGIYGTTDIKTLWKQFWSEVFPEIGRLGGLDADKMREYNRHVLLWRGFAGI
jgi:hypothetical protein